MDWALHQPEVRFNVRAERAEYERLFRHSARVLQDRLARLGGGDRTKEIPVAGVPETIASLHQRELKNAVRWDYIYKTCEVCGGSGVLSAQNGSSKVR